MAWSRLGDALGSGFGGLTGNPPAPRKKRSSVAGGETQNSLREALRARGGARNVAVPTAAATDIEDNEAAAAKIEKGSQNLDWLDLKAFAPKALQDVVDKIRAGELSVPNVPNPLRRSAPGYETEGDEAVPASSENDSGSDANASANGRTPRKPAKANQPPSGLRSALQARGGVRAAPPTAGDSPDGQLAAPVGSPTGSGPLITSTSASPLASVREDEDETAPTATLEALNSSAAVVGPFGRDLAEGGTEASPLTEAPNADDPSADDRSEEAAAAAEAEAKVKAEAEVKAAAAQEAAPEEEDGATAPVHAEAATDLQGAPEEALQQQQQRQVEDDNAAAAAATAVQEAHDAAAVQDIQDTQAAQVQGGSSSSSMPPAAEEARIRDEPSVGSAPQDSDETPVGEEASMQSSSSAAAAAATSKDQQPGERRRHPAVGSTSNGWQKGPDRGVAVTASATGYWVGKSGDGQTPSVPPKLAPEPPKLPTAQERKLKDIREFWGQNKNTVGFAGPQLVGSRLSRNEAQAALQRLVAAGGDFDEVRRLRKLISELD